MVIGYDLWDRFDGNSVADFDDLESALEFVRQQIEGRGPESIRRLALCEIADHGRQSNVLAEGDDLVAFAQKKAPSR